MHIIHTGAIFADHPREGEDSQFLGSVVVYTGENVEEVRQIINNDIYATSGVWDMKKIQIYPVSRSMEVSHGFLGVNRSGKQYVPAVRKPLA